MEPSRAATHTVRGWVRAALRSEGGRPVGSLPAYDGDAGDLLSAVVRQRVAPLLHAQSRSLAVPADLAEALDRIRLAGRARVPLQLLELSQAGRLLHDHDLAYLAFKGPALAVQTVGDPGERGFGDLDLFVDPRSAGDVVDLLVQHGWRCSRPLPPRDSWAWRRVVHSCHELTFYGASCSVDLHWRLDPTIDALPSFADAWARREEVEVGGVTVPTLGRQDALAHMCLNTARDGWRWLRTLVDVHRLARLDGAWDGFRPQGLMVQSLVVADALVGLPDTLPGHVRDLLADAPRQRRARVVSAATRAQESRVPTLDDAPGSVTIPSVRYRLAASASPRDLRTTLGTLVLPGWVLGEMTATSAWAGVPRGLGLRVVDLGRRSWTRLAAREHR